MEAVVKIVEHGVDATGVPGRPGYAITVDGVRYNSLNALARAKGLNPRTVIKARTQGHLAELLMDGVDWYKDQLKIEINGITYVSKADAAAKFRVTPSAISKAIARGRLSEMAKIWEARRNRV